MGGGNQVKQEGGTGASQRSSGYWYKNSNTTEKPSFKYNITEREDAVFYQGRPSDAAKYEYSIKTRINYVKKE